MPIATPGNLLTEFAVAAMDVVEDHVESYGGGTNAVEDPTEFIIWVNDPNSDKGYITVRVTFEQVD